MPLNTTFCTVTLGRGGRLRESLLDGSGNSAWNGIDSTLSCNGVVFNIGAGKTPSTTHHISGKGGVCSISSGTPSNNKNILQYTMCNGVDGGTGAYYNGNSTNGQSFSGTVCLGIDNNNLTKSNSGGSTTASSGGAAMFGPSGGGAASAYSSGGKSPNNNGTPVNCGPGAGSAGGCSFILMEGNPNTDRRLTGLGGGGSALYIYY